MKLGRFGHHPDPAIDFCIEVEELETIYSDVKIEFRPRDASFNGRIARALNFTVGGDINAIAAKAKLRRISDQVRY